jgi:serpin B
VTVDMMSGASGIRRATDGWQAVELPYRDGTLAALAVLPPERTDPCTVDAATLAALQAAEPKDVTVQLPRLGIRQTHELGAVLAGMGLPIEGDYSALGRDDLYISQVVQKTFLDVDEDGTEAAAATGVVVEVTSIGVPDNDNTVVFDRPFLLLLTDTATRSPLFLAAVHDPSA